MCDPATLPTSRNTTSLPASADGPSPCDSLGGLTIAQFGRAVAHANLSAQQARAAGLTMSGIYGPTGSGSSHSARLQSSLVSRLRAALSTTGSTLYSLTWKAWDTPQGRSLSRLRASAPRISATARTGWVTPTSRDWKDSGADIKPRADGSARLDQLPRQANLAGWPTSMAGTPAQNGNNAAGNNDSSRKTVAVLSGWGTPTATEPGGSAGRFVARKQDKVGGDAVTMLAHQAQLIGPARLMATGALLTGSDAAMESGGQLNPAHSRWLMGYPHGWDACAVTAMLSSPNKRRRSSAPRSPN